MKYIILISGHMQTGKNVAADFLIEKIKAKNLTVKTDLFAHDLKHNCKDDFKILANVLNNYAENLKVLVNTFTSVMTKNHMLDSLIEAIDEIKITDDKYFENKNNVTRALLQIYGTEIFRNRVDKNYWAKQVKNRAIESDADVIVVTDTRFPNEINVFNDINTDDIQVITIRVERKTGIINEHASEIALDSHKEWNYIVDNNGSLNDLNDAMGVVLDDIMNGSSNSIPFEIFINKN